jgi:hypothetical protein
VSACNESENHIDDIFIEGVMADVLRRGAAGFNEGHDWKMNLYEKLGFEKLSS